MRLAQFYDSVQGKWSHSLSLILLGMYIVGLLSFSGYRSATLSMTHDESSTFLNYIHQPLGECFYDPVCWGTANLHLTNSFLMQISVKLFGTQDFFVRLGSFIAHILYLLFSALLVCKISPHFWPRIGGFALLNCSPYLLDFFSLARGYGLACGFTLMSIYFLFCYWERGRISSLILSLVGAILAVLSNFTFLNYFAILFGGVSLVCIMLLLKWEKYLPVLSSFSSKSSPFIPLLILGISALLLTAMLYYPIGFLKNLGEFNYGVNSFTETYRALIKDHLQGQAYFGRSTESIFSVGIIILLVGSILWGLYHWRLQDKNALFYGLCSLMALALLLGLLIQFHWLDSKFLVNRKALIFVPVMGVPVALLLASLSSKFPSVGKVLAAGVAIFCTWHLFRSANFIQTREWYYDAFTKDMVEYVQSHPQFGDNSSLGVYWIFSHSSNFYLNRNQSHLYPLPYEKQLRSDSLYQFYYVEPGQGELLHPAYTLEKQFGYVGALYLRK